MLASMMSERAWWMRRTWLLAVVLLALTSTVAESRQRTTRKRRPPPVPSLAPVPLNDDRTMLDITRHRKRVIGPDGKVRTTVTYTQN
jgi:hypothetical protein